MVELTQALWDQMRADLNIAALPPIRGACQRLLDGTLGPLTEEHVEDLQAIERSLSKLTERVEGEPINWADDSEAAHALRAPLNSTIGFSRLMLKGIGGPVNEAQRQALETIYTTSRRLLNLFNLLLDTLLLSKGEIMFDIEPVRVNRILEELEDLGNTLADAHGFAFETDVPVPVAETVVHGDMKRLRQALTAILAASLLLNGEGKVRLSARRAEDMLLIQVESQRCQLPVQLLADLPNLLTNRADHSLPYEVHLRVGLARRLLAEMGGRLEIRQINKTGVFTVVMPTA